MDNGKEERSDFETFHESKWAEFFIIIFHSYTLFSSFHISAIISRTSVMGHKLIPFEKFSLPF